MVSIVYVTLQCMHGDVTHISAIQSTQYTLHVVQYVLDACGPTSRRQVGEGQNSDWQGGYLPFRHSAPLWRCVCTCCASRLILFWLRRHICLCLLLSYGLHVHSKSQLLVADPCKHFPSIAIPLLRLRRSRALSEQVWRVLLLRQPRQQRSSQPVVCCLRDHDIFMQHVPETMTVLAALHCVHLHDRSLAHLASCQAVDPWEGLLPPGEAWPKFYRLLPVREPVQHQRLHLLP